MQIRLAGALFVAVLGVSACGQNGGANQQGSTATTQAGPPPVAADAVAVRGTVTIDGLAALPPKLLPQIKLRLRLLDMSDPSVVPPVVAERLEPAPARLPYSYALPYAAADINPEGRYAFEAALVSGADVLYGTPEPVAVLTQGAGAQANVALARGGGLPAPDIAPADLIRQDFAKVERSIGGMRKISGESIDETTTRAWDAFLDSSGVRFARQVVDYEKGGVISYRFAYRGDEPWVIARDRGGAVLMIGWGKDGSLQLNRDSNDREASESEIAELREMAIALHREASAKRG